MAAVAAAVPVIVRVNGDDQSPVSALHCDEGQNRTCEDDDDAPPTLGSLIVRSSSNQVPRAVCCLRTALTSRASDAGRTHARTHTRTHTEEKTNGSSMQCSER